MQQKWMQTINVSSMKFFRPTVYLNVMHKTRIYRHKIRVITLTFKTYFNLIALCDFYHILKEMWSIIFGISDSSLLWIFGLLRVFAVTRIFRISWKFKCDSWKYTLADKSNNLGFKMANTNLKSNARKSRSEVFCLIQQFEIMMVLLRR